MTYPEEGVGAQPRWDFRDDVTDGEVASDRVDRNDMAERSREGLDPYR